MAPTIAQAETTSLVSNPDSSLGTLLSRSEDEFYGCLQRIWNNVVQLEDLGLVRTEQDKFIYAYRFAEAELQRAYTDRETVIGTTYLNSPACI